MALIFRHGNCMHRIIFSFVVCVAVPCFSTLPHKGTIFRKIYRVQFECFDFLYNFLSVSFLILRRIHWHIITNTHRTSCKVSVILLRFQSSVNFLDRFPKNAQIKFHENPSAESRDVPYGQTVGLRHKTMLIVAFRNFAIAPVNI